MAGSLDEAEDVEEIVICPLDDETIEMLSPATRYEEPSDSLVSDPEIFDTVKVDVSLLYEKLAASPPNDPASLNCMEELDPPGEAELLEENSTKSESSIPSLYQNFLEVPLTIRRTSID